MRGQYTKESILILMVVSEVAVFVTGQPYYWPTVKVSTGMIQANVEQTSVGPAINFLGIPYAQPPVGELRFKPPKPVKKWEGIFRAHSYGAPCMQNLALMYGPKSPLPPWLRGQSEDCLTLNLHVPGEAINPNAKMAVMVYIHGGSYIIGNAKKHDGTFLAAKENIIIATINYRLGVFGFLTTGDNDIPGNMGLMDQILALKWIQANIGKFGGDKDRVTIFGIDAGGMSVSLLAISPKASGLFSGAISESGVEFTRVLPEKANLDDQDVFKDYADKVGCTSDDEDGLISCLQNVPAEQLINQDYDIYSWLNSPIVDGKIGLIPKQPSHLWEEHAFNPANYMTGFLKYDGSILVDYLLKGRELGFYQNGIGIDDALTLVDKSLQLQFADSSGNLPFDKAKANVLIEGQYFRDPTNNVSNILSLLDYLRDMSIFHSTILSLRAVTRSSDDIKGYLYYMTYTRSWNILEGAMPYGPMHGADGGFIFGRYINKDDPFYQLPTPSDRAVCAAMVHAWTSFAKDGQPKYLDADGVEHKWLRYDETNAFYLEIEEDMGPGSMKEKLLPEADIFWTTTFTAIFKNNGGLSSSEESSNPEQVAKG